MFQSTVVGPMAFGVVGEFYKGAPWRAKPGIIDSTGVTNANEVGRAFTQVAGNTNDDHCTVGGAPAEGAQFFGILANPKEYALYGVTNNSLGPTLSLPQYSKGDFVYNTTGLIVPFQGAGNVGDFVDFDTTTGLLWPRPFVGNLGAATLAITTNVGTVAGFVAGSPAITVGTVFQTTNGPATVLSLGTGTGGNGTYNLSVIANQGATANTVYAATPPAGRAEILGARVAFKSIPAAGVGIISLNG